MSKQDDTGSRLSKLYNILTRRKKTVSTEPVKREYSLEELVAIRRRKSKGDIERLKKETQVQKKCEILYRIDPLVFGGVNRLRRAIVSPRIYFTGGDDADREAIEEWAKSVRLQRVLWEAVFDILIYGYAVIEKVRDSSGKIVMLVVVDPKTVDWQKDGDKIKIDEKTQEPVGFVQQTNEGEIPLARDDVILLRFFYLGKECLGISPLEPAFKASWIRLNLEESYGEAMFRHGFPTFYFRVGDETHPLTPELMKEASKILKDFDSASEVILPNWIVPSRLESKVPVAQVVDLWVFLAGEIARAVDNPIGFVVPAASKESKGGAEFSNIDFERAVMQYQSELKEQLEEQLLAEVRIDLELKSLPELEFGSSSPETQSLRMNMISTLVEKGVLHMDRTTENHVRAELGLPLYQEEEPEDVNCVYFKDQECQIRKEKKIPLTELFKYCQQCPKIKNK